jgi:queuine/archaeosine tRNA-ribosyltransferase
MARGIFFHFTRLISCTAALALNAPAFMPPATIGQTSMPPEANAMDISIQLSIRNFTFFLLLKIAQVLILECCGDHGRCTAF